MSFFLQRKLMDPVRTLQTLAYRLTLSPDSRILFVIAHPDDESMFFSPILSYLKTHGNPQNIYFVSLSNGNANKLGKTREIELRTACQQIFSIPSRNVHIVNNQSKLRSVHTLPTPFSPSVLYPLSFNTQRIPWKSIGKLRIFSHTSPL